MVEEVVVIQHLMVDQEVVEEDSQETLLEEVVFKQLIQQYQQILELMDLVIMEVVPEETLRMVEAARVQRGILL
jgi:hypothetical protein